MLNNSKYFSGITMVLLNLGAKYVPMDLTQNHEKVLNSVIVRRVVLFTIFFMATKDIIISIILTIAFIVLFGGILNEKSKFSIVGKDNTNLNKISKEEYSRCLKIVQMFEIQNS
jgi:hypothetical protein